MKIAAGLALIMGTFKVYVFVECSFMLQLHFSGILKKEAEDSKLQCLSKAIAVDDDDGGVGGVGTMINGTSFRSRNPLPAVTAGAKCHRVVVKSSSHSLQTLECPVS